MNPQAGQIRFNINEEIKKGRYANNVRLTQTQAEATIDFIFMHAETGGDYVARVIVSPDFLKQIAELLANQTGVQAVTKPGQTVTKQIGFRADQVDEDPNISTKVNLKI